MRTQKNKGAYYTPIKLSNFIVKYLDECFTDNLSILEPSVGDGSFIKALNNSFRTRKKVDITIVDLDKLELEKAKKEGSIHNKFTKIVDINDDFLTFHKKHSKQYDLVIGNPPYIKSNLLAKKQIELCKEIHKNENLLDKKINNIWTAFIVGANKFLKKDAILAYVLPTDLLQVKYAEEIRVFLEEQFDRLEIFTLDKYMFDDIEQHTVLLFAYKKSNEKGTFFYKITDIKENKFEKISSNGLMIYETKWTHYILEPDEIKLLNSINKKLDRVDDYIISKPGIVTGANKYFILDKDKVKEHKLEKYVEPIVQKSLFIKNNIDLNEKDIQHLINSHKPMFLLSLKDDTKVTKNLESYLSLGRKESIDKRYKCSIRNNWYCIPNISLPTEGFFFKRYHKVPKLIRNSANVHVTDSAYKIVMKDHFNINSFIYSFFNIVTLIFSELIGRKYGGGVMELIPSEFKNLPIYYQTIESKVFNSFEKEFNEEVVFNNEVFEYLNLNEEEIVMLENIYTKLTQARMH